MAWSKVYYDTSKQDQVTSSATFDEAGRLQSITESYVFTYVAVDDGGLSGQPNTYSAMAAGAGGNSVPVPGSSVTVPGSSATTWQVKQVMPRRTSQSPFVFEVQCTAERKFQIQPPSVTKWNVTIASSGQKTTQQAYQDKDGNDIVNTAGQSYDPSVNETIYDEVLKVSYSTLTPPDLSSYRGKVNSDSVAVSIQGYSKTFTARQMLCDEADMTTTFTLDDATPVWRVSLSFINRKDTWIDTILDQGYYEIDAGELYSILDFYTQQPMSAPALLDASGAQLAVGGTPHYSTFKIEGETALSPLFVGL